MKESQEQIIEVPNVKYEVYYSKKSQYFQVNQVRIDWISLLWWDWADKRNCGWTFEIIGRILFASSQDELCEIFGEDIGLWEFYGFGEPGEHVSSHWI